MINSKLLAVLALVSTIGTASAQSFHPSAAGKETTTKPWTAPVGHRRPTSRIFLQRPWDRKISSTRRTPMWIARSAASVGAAD